MKIRVTLLVLSILILGCRDEFILESDIYDQIMVVDGMISNEPGPYTIYLSQTAPVNSDANIPLEDYIVTLYDNTGKYEILSETESGKYVTFTGGIQGIIGNKYSISIINPDGVEYLSDFQELKQPVELESVYHEIDTTVSINYPYKIPGYQFYIDTKSSSTQDNYFLWDITETFEYDSDYRFEYYENRLGMTFYNVPSLLKLKTCWKTQKVNSIFTGNTSNLSIPQITHQPLHFVSTETKKLSKRYSILLTQYMIGEKEYKYWQEMEEILSEKNFLVATQPYNVTGNIQNVNNPNEKVYGYFTVATVSKTRIFVDRPSLDFYFGTCNVLVNVLEIVDFQKFNDAPFYFVEIDGGIGLGSLNCIDCTSEGGILVKPYFW
ncbi:MAG: DUF4249 domain-containing protein [Bacteroidales bacterium]|jgi:hypothetical protein|nr:DUF4249 domain-containing protein [Bacteroidales bacterium]